jgi:hypothetical protein
VRTHGKEIADEHGEEDDGRSLRGTSLRVVHLEEEGAHDDAQHQRADDLVPELVRRSPHRNIGSLDRLHVYDQIKINKQNSNKS